MKYVLASLLLLSLAFAAAAEGASIGQSVALPIVLNIVPGFGLGSTIQGDRTGGLVGFCGELLAGGLCGIGIAMDMGGIMGGMIDQINSGSSTGDGSSHSTISGGTALFFGGLILWAGTKIYEVARAIGFARRLGRERGLAAARSSISPILVSAAGGGLEPGLALELSF